MIKITSLKIAIYPDILINSYPYISSNLLAVDYVKTTTAAFEYIYQDTYMEDSAL